MKWNSVFVFLLLYCLPILAISAPVFRITVADNSINVSPGEHVLIVYTVQNVSGIDMPNMRYFLPALTTIAVGSTCNNFLAKGASCNLTLNFTAPTQTGQLLLGPTSVCGYQGRICSAPNIANRVRVNIGANLFGKAYLVNQNSNNVTVIDRVNYMPIELLSVGTTPVFIAMTPDHTKGYIGNVVSSNVSAIHTATNTVSTIPTGGTFPQFVGITPDGTRTYVMNTGGNNVTVIDNASDSVLTTIVLGGATNPIAIVFMHSGAKAYVTDGSSNMVSVLDAVNNTFISNIPVTQPAGFPVITPDDAKVFFNGQAAPVGSVGVISTATDTLVTTIPAGNDTNDIAILPDGSKVYAINILSSDVTVINAITNVVITTIALPVGAFPQGIRALHTDSSRIYVANTGTSNVSVIDTASNTIMTNVPAGSGITRLEVTPEDTEVWGMNFNANTITVISVSTNAVTHTVSSGGGDGASDVGFTPLSG